MVQKQLGRLKDDGQKGDIFNNIDERKSKIK